MRVGIFGPLWCVPKSTVRMGFAKGWEEAGSRTPKAGTTTPSLPPGNSSQMQQTCPAALGSRPGRGWLEVPMGTGGISHWKGETVAVMLCGKRGYRCGCQEQAQKKEKRVLGLAVGLSRLARAWLEQPVGGCNGNPRSHLGGRSQGGQPGW